MTNEISTTIQSSAMAAYTEKDLFDQMQRAGKMLCSSQLVPKHLQGKQADCTLIAIMALDMKINPIMLAQNIFFVHGQPGWKTTYLISRANASGKLAHPIRFETAGEGLEMAVTAIALLKKEYGGKEIRQTASMKMAQAEGWTQNEKYKTMPELMLSYRAATFLIRLNMPEIMFGMQSQDELEDVGLTPAPLRVVNPAPTAPRPKRAKAAPDTSDIPAFEGNAEEDAEPFFFVNWDGEEHSFATQSDLVQGMIEAINESPHRAAAYEVVQQCKVKEVLEAYEQAFPQE